VLAAANPTGIASLDTAILQALVVAINASGGNVDVRLGAGTYVVNASLGIVTVPNVHVVGRGRGVTKIDFSAAVSATTCLTFTGSVGTSKPLTSDTVAGGLTLACTPGDEAGLAPDDYILIGSSAYYEPRTGSHGAG